MVTAAFELKDTRGANSLPFSSVEDHQINYGDAIESDTGVFIRVQGTNGEPDYIYLRGEPSYIVIRYPDYFCIITLDAFKAEKKTSTRKSLTGERAVQIAVRTVSL